MLGHGPGKSIGVICRTIGRPSLVKTVASFVSIASEDDRMLLLFDGVKATVSGWRNVESYELPKAGNWGHPHALKAMNDRLLATDYLTFIDDDDVWVSGAFETLRPMLDGVSLVAFPFFESGIVGNIVFSEREGYIGGLKIAVPNAPPFAWPDITSDGSMYRAAAKRFPLRLCGTPLQRVREGR